MNMKLHRWMRMESKLLAPSTNLTFILSQVWPIPNPPTRYTSVACVANSSVNMTLQYNPIVKKTVLNF